MEVFVQPLINGLTLGAIYGLLAIGYTMVFGVIGMVDFAHGDVFMLSAFIALILLALTFGWFGTHLGGCWIDVPAEYGPRKTLYNRFVRWSAKGVWQALFRAYDTNTVRRQIEDQGAVPTSRPSAPGAGRAASVRCSTAAATPSSACSAG